MSESPPNGLTATEARKKIQEGWLSSTELVKACLNRIDETEDQLHAWAYLDHENALLQAQELDHIRQNGKPMGPLHGIPIAIKDNIDTKNFPTEFGTSIHAGRLPKEDARIIEKLREAGAVILGKTVTTEFAFVHPGKTRNPHNTSHTPGGSSSGSAAAVAGYHVPLAIGTQTNGSVIRPAAFCGTYGFKPSNGIISRTGILQTSNSLDQVGVFGRSLEDVALLADVISGYDSRDNNSYARPRPNLVEGINTEPPVEPQLAWFDLPFADRLSEDTQDGLEELVEALGGQVEKIQAPDNFLGLIDTQRIIHEYEICQHLADDFTNHWDQISDTLKPIVQRGQKISKDEYEHAIDVMGQFKSFFADFFNDYDAIITPSSTGEAPQFADSTGDPIFSTLWTLAGLPCINLPLLVGRNGLPIGAQLVGAYEEDDRLLRTANWILTQLQ